MPGTKEIRGKIASVKSTQKITKAMQMVADQQDASARRTACALARPYADKIRRVIGHLRKANPDYRHPFLVERAKSKTVGLHRHLHRSRPVRRLERQPVQSDAGRDARLAGQGRGDLAVPDRLKATAFFRRLPNCRSLATVRRASATSRISRT